MKVPIDRVLAASATSVFPMGNGIAVPFFDTAASTSSEEATPYEMSNATSTIDTTLLFDFDFAGWSDRVPRVRSYSGSTLHLFDLNVSQLLRWTSQERYSSPTGECLFRLKRLQ